MKSSTGGNPVLIAGEIQEPLRTERQARYDRERREFERRCAEDNQQMIAFNKMLFPNWRGE